MSKKRNNLRNVIYLLIYFMLIKVSINMLYELKNMKNVYLTKTDLDTESFYSLKNTYFLSSGYYLLYSQSQSKFVSETHVY